MTEKNKRPMVPVTADQCVLAGSGVLSGVIMNALAHSNGSVGLLVGGIAVAASLMLVPKELRLRNLKAAIPTFYVGDEDEHEAHTEKLQPKRSFLRNDEDDDDDLRAPTKLPAGMFTFSSVLKNFTPSLDTIYLGQLEDGTAIYSAVKDLCHVALAGVTGGGKTSIIRLLMSQICKAGASVLLLNPHYTRYDLESGEDWTPFEPYLIYDPMECRKYETIDYYLKQVATELLPKRLNKYAHSKPLGKPYFVVLDELPAIVAKVPDAPKYLSEILREGRKVGIYLIVASQDFLVKTIGVDSGGVRKCFRTALYTGGDATTANNLLNTTAGNLIPEDQLGKGTVMLRNLSITKAALAHVPYVDNESIYDLLGASTYVSDDEDDDDVLHLANEKNTNDPSFADLYQSMTGNSLAEAEYRMPANSRSQGTLRDTTGYRVPSTPRMADLPMREPVNALVEPCTAREQGVNVQGQIHDVHEDEGKKFTPAEVGEVLKAYAAMVRSGQQVTRKGLIEYLNKNVGNHWNTGTKCYPKFQAICDDIGI